MYTSIILNILSLRKLHGLPISIVLLEMHVLIRFTRMDINTKTMMTRENRLNRITSITFIFDRGKYENSKKVTASWSSNLKHKFIYNKTQHCKLRMSNSKMPFMFTYSDVTKHKPSNDRKASEKKLGNNQLNDISSQYENKRKINRHASPLLQRMKIH